MSPKNITLFKTEDSMLCIDNQVLSTEDSMPCFDNHVLSTEDSMPCVSNQQFYPGRQRAVYW